MSRIARVEVIPLVTCDLVSPEPIVKDGYMDLPTGPGLGLELNQEIVERYRVDGKIAPA